MSENKFIQALSVDFSQLEKEKGKGGAKYVPWAIAWSEFKKVNPRGYFKFIENPEGGHVFTEGDAGFMVKVMVSDGEEVPIEITLSRPILDFKMKADMNFTVVEVNKALFRCLTKCCGLFGSGLMSYATEEYYEFEIGAEFETLREEILELASVMSKEYDEKELAIKIIGNKGHVKKIKTVEEAKDIIEKMNEEIKKLASKNKTTKKEEK